MAEKKPSNECPVLPLLARAVPLERGNYQGWRCLECAQDIAVIEQPRVLGTDIPDLGPEGALVQLKCPHCQAERLYGLNDRVLIQVPSWSAHCSHR